MSSALRKREPSLADSCSLRGSAVGLPHVIIVRGAPGVGKSTVARKLCSLLNARKRAYIPVDALQEFDQRGPSKDKMRLGVYHAAITAKNFVREGFTVIVDYVFDNTLDLELFIHEVSSGYPTCVGPVSVQVFYLYAPIEKIHFRNQTRQHAMSKELLEKLYKVCERTQGRIPGEVLVNTTKLSPRQTAMLMAEERSCITSHKGNTSKRTGQQHDET